MTELSTGVGKPQLELRQVVGSSPLGPLGNVHPLDFALLGGQVGVVFGGKETSSLFRLIMGTGKIDQGELVLEGTHVRDAKSNDKGLSAWRQRIGFGFREKGLLSNLTLMDNVDLPAKYHDRYHEGMTKNEIAISALRQAGIPENLWHVRPDRINWEIRKRVLLARSIVLDPRVLILDDPSALIASPTMPAMLNWLFEQKAKGRGILIGTNDYPFGLAAADWVLHPETNRITTDYRDFIADEWIKSADILRALGVRAVRKSA